MHSSAIWIYGAGAVGSTLGGYLADAGHAVTLIGRNPHMEAVRAGGLHIEGIWGERHVPDNLDAVTALPEGAPPDIVFITAKSWDTAATAEALRDHIGPDTLVVSLQNGVGNVATLQEILGPERVVAGMVIIGFEIVEPGRTRVTVQADVMRFGRAGGAPDAKVEHLVHLLTDAGLPAEVEPAMDSVQWGKVLYNSALNPLGAILQCHYGALLAEDTWATIEALITEAFAVFAKAGITVRWATAPEYLAFLRDVQIPATFDHRPTMITDLNTRGRTEVDVINGAIVKAGEQVGVPTPVNSTLCQIVRALSARRAAELAQS